MITVKEYCLMSSNSPELALNLKYTPKIDLLLDLYCAAKNVSMPSSNVTATPRPSATLFSEPSSALVQPLHSDFASTNGPDSLKISDEDVRATVSIEESLWEGSQWNNKSIPGICKEICIVEEAFLKSLVGIEKELTIIQGKEVLSKAEKEIFLTALRSLGEYIALQKSYCQTISALKLPDPLGSNEEHGKDVLQVFFAIYQDKSLKQEQAFSGPLMGNLEKIDSILKLKNAKCEDFRKELPFIASKFNYEVNIPVIQLLTRRPMLCTEWLKHSGVGQCLSEEKGTITECLINVKCDSERKNLLLAIEKTGYIRPPNLAQFLDSLCSNTDYSANNILLETKGRELKNSFIAFAEIKGVHIRHQIEFFQIAYSLLEPRRSTPLTCTDLKLLLPYCSFENPLKLPKETMLRLQAAFREKENSPATVRKVVDALIPAMENIHQNLKLQLNEFQYSAEIIDVLVFLPEIQGNLNQTHDLFSLTTREIEALPLFLKNIFTDKNSFIRRNFEEKTTLVREDPEYAEKLTPFLRSLPESAKTLPAQPSPEELKKLREIIDAEYNTVLDSSGSENATLDVDSFLRRIIERQFHKKIKNLYTLDKGSTKQKIRTTSSAISEKNLASGVFKDRISLAILEDKDRMCGRILGGFKETAFYNRLVESIHDEAMTHTLIQASIDAYIDPEVHKEIKLAATPSRVIKIKEEFLKKISKFRPDDEKKAKNLFKEMLSKELIETEFYFILKKMQSQKEISESCSVAIVANKKKILKKVEKKIIATEWHKGLKFFFEISPDNIEFRGESIASISDIVRSVNFTLKVNEGRALIEAKIKQHIKQEEERIFIAIKNKTACDLIEAEFNRQIHLLKEAQIFSDALVQKLIANKDKMLKPHLKKMLDQKGTPAFMRNYTTLLQNMPFYVLKSLPNYFQNKSLKPNVVFSEDFLQSLGEMSESISGKKLTSTLKAYQPLKQGVEPTSSILPYHGLNQYLHENFPSKKPVEVKKAPRSKKPDSRDIPRLQMPRSAVSCITKNKFQFLAEAVKQQIALDDSGWRIERKKSSDSKVASCENPLEYNCIEVYDQKTLVFTAESLGEDNNFTAHRHELKDVAMAVAIMTKTLQPAAEVPQATLAISINAAKQEVPQLMQVYVKAALDKNLFPEVTVNGHVLEGGALYHKLHERDKSLARKYKTMMGSQNPAKALDNPPKASESRHVFLTSVKRKQDKQVQQGKVYSP